MTDDDKTTEAPKQPLHEPERDDRPKRFTRSRDDRMLAGVAGGLGRYFSVDPLIVRIAFAVTVFFGGLGVIAYAVLALFVPSDPAVPGGEPEVAPVQRSRWIGLAAIGAVVLIAVPAAGSLFFWADPWPWDHGGGWGFGWLLLLIAAGVGIYALVTRRRDGSSSLDAGRILAIAGVALLAVFGLSALAVFSAWVGATGSGVVIAAIVAAIGVMLVIGAFVGGARWLIAPALALAIPLAAVSAADVSFSGGVGEREYRPVSTAALPEDGYELGVGRLAIDLRDLDWTEREVISLDVDLGVGEAVVAVPEHVCVSADLRAGLGEVAAAGDDSGGFDTERTIGDGATATPRLELDGDVDLGALRVINDDDADLDHPHWGNWQRDNDEAARSAAERACSTLS
jgi:phage shock protein PspC (stress-responsive transcriptional regulator)